MKAKVAEIEAAMTASCFCKLPELYHDRPWSSPSMIIILVILGKMQTQIIFIFTMCFKYYTGFTICQSQSGTNNQVAKYLVENYVSDEMNVKPKF